MHSPSKTTARIVGALFLMAMVTSLVGAGLIEVIFGPPLSPAKILANETRVVAGVLLELTNGLAVIGIAFLLYPLLKKLDEALAAGYLAFRIVEAVIIVVALAIPLAMIALSREFSSAAPDAFAVAGTALSALRTHLYGQLLGIFFSLGAFVLYSLLFHSRLVPRFISVWGLVAVVMIFAWNLSEMFGLGIEFGIVLGLPIILNEIFLGIWLLVRGFDRPATVAGAVRPAIDAT